MMYSPGDKVTYSKASTNHGEGKIPVGAVGTVLKFVYNPQTSKLLVDFGVYGKAILPLSCVQK